MIDLFVARYDAVSQGEDIVNELVGSIPVALLLGRKHLDDNAQRMQPVSMEAIYRDGLRGGHLILCYDSVHGTWIGKITSISHKQSGVERTTTIGLTRVA